MNFRPLWLDRNRNVGIWSRSSYSIMLLRQRGKQMIVDLESWEAGYDDGLRGRPSQCTSGLDRFSYSSGYFQARAYRKGNARSAALCSLVNPTGRSTTRRQLSADHHLGCAKALSSSRCLRGGLRRRPTRDAFPGIRQNENPSPRLCELD